MPQQPQSHRPYRAAGIPLHQPLARQDKRPSASIRGYNKRWKAIRDAFIRSNPLCAECSERGRTVLAVVVHHVRPKAEGGGDEAANLRALCVSCHERTKR